MKKYLFLCCLLGSAFAEGEKFYSLESCGFEKTCLVLLREPALRLLPEEELIAHGLVRIDEETACEQTSFCRGSLTFWGELFSEEYDRLIVCDRKIYAFKKVGEFELVLFQDGLREAPVLFNFKKNM